MKNMKKAILLLISFTLLFIATMIVSGSGQDYPYPDDWDFWGLDETALFFGLGFTMCLVIFLIPLIIAILICIWIYKDAEKRGKSGPLWFLLLILASLFFSFVGLIVIIIIWLAVRPPEGVVQTPTSPTAPPHYSSERRCPSCGRVIPNDARVCPYCGKNFEVK